MNSEERTLVALYAIELERIRRGRALLEYQRELALEQTRGPGEQPRP